MRTFEAAGGVHLAAERWVPAGEARAHVVYVHGLGEHRRARPYLPFFGKLAANGYAVLAFDLRGHGASEGPRLYARDFAVLEQDVARAVEVAADDAQGRPVFLLGGSLGGLLALAAALEPHESLAGVVAAAPALDTAGASPLMKRLLPLLALVAPRVRFDPGLDVLGIARDPEALAAYLDDPLMQIGSITPALAAATLAGIERVMHHADDITLPLLLLHGLADRVVPADGTIALHALAGSRDKTLRTYPGAYHHLFLDAVREEATRDTLAWLAARS
ncbi:MAG: alpha/beta fold hydrolase [Burkholderiales bacterium]|nr:alpha/beta fold hydrolase [Burkholderiales bacterium]